MPAIFVAVIAAEALTSASTIVLAAIAAVILALPVPSKEAEVPVTSPVRAIVRPVARAVAVLALPVKGPTNEAAVTVPEAVKSVASAVPVRVGEAARTTEPVPDVPLIVVPLIFRTLPVPAVSRVLLVRVSVVALPIRVSVEVGKVNVPVLLITAITGVVKV